GPGQPRQLSRDVGPTEPAEIEAIGPRRPPEAGEPDEDRMASSEAIGSARQGDEDTFGRQVVGQERQQVAARAVEPLDVLDDDERRRVGGEPRDELEEALELPRLALRCRRERVDAGSYRGTVG